MGHDPDNALKLWKSIEGRDHLPPNQRIHLIGYEPPGPNGAPDAKVIASVGNPDTATSTGIYVPGTTTNLESAAGDDLGRAIALHGAAESLDDQGDGSAVILWLGYDAPDNIPDAANPEYAQKGASDLVGFVDGLALSHDDGVPSRTTVIGHSYGSTLVGYADSGDNYLGVDDVVTLGSPGMGVDSAGELHTSGEHVWAGSAWDDPVQNAPGLGTDPTDDTFGATEFVTGTSGHSDYWLEGSASLRNQALILTGQHEYVTQVGEETLLEGVLDPMGIKD